MKELLRTLRTRALLPLTLLVPLATTCADSTGADRGGIVIGGLFSLTGDWSSLGLAGRAAMELGVEDVNAQFADRDLRLRVDVRDTKLDPATALKELESLHDRGVQVVMGPQSSAELAALKPYVDSQRMLVVSPSSTAGSLAVSGDGILRLTPSDTLEGEATAALMWSDGIRTLVPLWRGDAGNRGLNLATRASFAARGGSVAAGSEYATTTAQFAPVVTALGAQVRQALASRPASQVAVYLAGFDEVAAVLAAAAADPTLATVRWYGADGIALSPALLTPQAAAFAERVGYPAPIFGLDDDARDRWKSVADRIEKRSGVAADAFSLAVYDGVWLAAQAYLASPSHVDGNGLKEKFASAAEAYFGTTGWTALNAAGDRRFADFDFWAIRGGRWVRVAKYDTRSRTFIR